MRTWIVFVVAVVFCAPMLVAQKISERPASWDKQIALTVGANVVTGKASENYGIGYCLDGIFYYHFGKGFFASASIGLHSLSPDIEQLKREVGVPAGMTMTATMIAVPIMIGGRYNFSTTGFQPYIGLEAGPVLEKTTVTAEYQGRSSSSGDEDWEFALIPKLGFRIPIDSYLDFDMHSKYMYLTKSNSSGWVTVNAGIAYTIR